VKKLFLVNATPKGRTLRQTAPFEPLCVKIGQVVFAAGLAKKSKKIKKIKNKKIKISKCYISPMWGEDPTEPIATQLGMLGPLPDVINSTMFYINRSSSLRALGVRKSPGPIRTATRPYNSQALPGLL
jgi:hypothetical protein